MFACLKKGFNFGKFNRSQKIEADLLNKTPLGEVTNYNKTLTGAIKL
jgi:hypothetical protein